MHLVNAIVTFVIAAIIYYVVTDIYALVFNLHGKDKLPSELSNTHNHAAIVMTAVFVCAVAPICEEFFFRGFLFGTLRKMRVTVAGRDLSVFIAAVITGILFGLVHTGSASSQYLVPLGFLGFMLCMVRWRTGSLYPCMALHSANNAVALGYEDLHWTAPGDHRADARLVGADRADRRADRRCASPPERADVARCRLTASDTDSGAVMIYSCAMRRHLLSSAAAVAATGSLGLFAASALADGSSGAVAPGSAAAVTQTATVTTSPADRDGAADARAPRRLQRPAVPRRDARPPLAATTARHDDRTTHDDRHDASTTTPTKTAPKPEAEAEAEAEAEGRARGRRQAHAELPDALVIQQEQGGAAGPLRQGHRLGQPLRRRVSS